MNTPIVRMFADEAKAREALRLLREERFAQEDLNLLLPAQAATADAAGSLESLVSAILGSGASRAQCKAYADAIRAGQVMVAVRAPWGMSGDAIRVMDECGPLADPAPAPREPYLSWDESAPLSSALRLPTLLRNRPMPVSNIFGLEDLPKSRPWFGGLVSDRFALFGQPKLSRNPAPLSSLFGLPTLTRDGKPMFGGLASHDFYLFGKPRLSRNPAPLSSLIGWGTLSGK